MLYGLCSKVYSISDLQKTNESYFALINSIAFYIQNNYKNNISLKELAKSLGYNYSYLSAFFNKHFEMNFSAYVNSCRVQLAGAYLRQTNKSITEISDICGFDTIRNFNRVFKNEFNVSPKEYRITFNNNTTESL